MAFDPTRATLVARGCNEGLNFGKMAADSRDTGDGDCGSGGGIGRKLEVWHCVGGHPKRNFLKRAEEKEKRKSTTAAPTINVPTGKQR